MDEKKGLMIVNVGLGGLNNTGDVPDKKTIKEKIDAVKANMAETGVDKQFDLIYYADLSRTDLFCSVAPYNYR
jgi:hypothetical protein